jgi:rhodanese-related sulfurtransferase
VPSEPQESSTIDRMPAECRQAFVRVLPADLAAEVRAGALLVDSRPVEQRERDGELPGAVVVDRNVLEWRLDPTSPHRLPEVTSADRRIIIVCNEGYSSTLAAHTLIRLGLRNATDLAGGFQAWRAMAPTSH